MLKQRVITALILIPMVVWGVLELPVAPFAAIVALFILLGAWEWMALAGATQTLGRLLGVALYGAGVVALWFFGRTDEVVDALIYAAALWWLLALVLVYNFNAGRVYSLHRIHKLLIGALILLPTWIALVTLHAQLHYGPEYVLFLLVLIWAADSGAYFAGRRFGRRKLAPRVSPGKSWEGVVGGLIAVVIVALCWSLWREYSLNYGLLFMLIAAVIGLVSVLGDLVESLFKRQAGIKDSGTIFPGHGGVLDRIDSLTAAAPLFLLGLELIRGVL